MISPFRSPNHSPEESAEHKALRTAEAVARKLEGLPDPKPPPYVGKTSSALARHRIEEIDMTTDLGWGDPKAERLMKHHAREAVSTAANWARNWMHNTDKGGPGGVNNLPKYARTLIDGLKSRLAPALHVAEAEFDPDHHLRQKLTEITSDHLRQIDVIEEKYQPRHAAANSYGRKKLRDAQRVELGDVLTSHAESIEEWEKELLEGSREVGFPPVN